MPPHHDWCNSGGEQDNVSVQPLSANSALHEPLYVMKSIPNKQSILQHNNWLFYLKKENSSSSLHFQHPSSLYRRHTRNRLTP